MNVTEQDTSPAESVLQRFVPEATLTPAARHMRRAVAEFVPEMRADATTAEQRRALTDKVSGHLADLGVFDLGTPVEHGGLAAGARDLAEVLREVARGDGSAGWLTATAANNHMLALAYPPEAVKEIFTSGTDPKGPRLVGASVFARKVGKARRADGGWQVSGRWGFASGCRTAEWAMVGADFTHEDGRPGRGLALIPRSAYEILDDWQVSGMAATSSNTIVATDDVFVPEHHFLDLAHLPARMNGLRERYQGVAFTWGEQARIVVITLQLAAVALGMAEGALETLVAQAPRRTPFNLPYPTIADSPGTQIATGRVAARVDVARAVIERIADGIDRISADGLDVTPVEATRLHMDLVLAIRLASDAIADAEETLGTSSAALSNPVQRYHRDVRVLASHGAIRFDPLAELTGKDALGRTVAPTFAGGLPDVS
ncbi:acyl-CoA dehydrogenase family protein [Streptomyces mangrovisoli]|uniref:Oxidoreductase n=1 Tax=Streptomyces mangrovisoli TaxID=1428628 RepID=A0A1J4NV57_9ACTN|nr:acyl-CoA dehydrogenase family protein [Streptomyces mangrovisoli]OIJ65014.1 hypothetical protein WN71_025780 [Streptomyces mangrovisoli]